MFIDIEKFTPITLKMALEKYKTNSNITMRNKNGNNLKQYLSHYFFLIKRKQNACMQKPEQGSVHRKKEEKKYGNVIIVLYNMNSSCHSVSKFKTKKLYVNVFIKSDSTSLSCKYKGIITMLPLWKITPSVSNFDGSEVLSSKEF